MQNTLRYTDMKKRMIIVYYEFKNYKLCVRRSILKLPKFLNVTCF